MLRLPWWLNWWRICLQCRRPGFKPWVRKIPWRRNWQPTPILLPGEFHRQRSLAGYSSWDREESDMTEWLSLHFTSDLHEAMRVESAMWGCCRKADVCKHGGGLLPDTRAAGTLISDFSASRSMREKCLLFKLPRVWYMLLQHPALT